MTFSVQYDDSNSFGMALDAFSRVSMHSIRIPLMALLNGSFGMATPSAARATCSKSGLARTTSQPRPDDALLTPS